MILWNSKSKASVFNVLTTCGAILCIFKTCPVDCSHAVLCTFLGKKNPHLHLYAKMVETPMNTIFRVFLHFLSQKFSGKLDSCIRFQSICHKIRRLIHLCSIINFKQTDYRNSKGWEQAICTCSPQINNSYYWTCPKTEMDLYILSIDSLSHYDLGNSQWTSFYITQWVKILPIDCAYPNQPFLKYPLQIQINDDLEH